MRHFCIVIAWIKPDTPAFFVYPSYYGVRHSFVLFILISIIHEEEEEVNRLLNVVVLLRETAPRDMIACRMQLLAYSSAYLNLVQIIQTYARMVVRVVKESVYVKDYSLESSVTK